MTTKGKTVTSKTKTVDNEELEKKTTLKTEDKEETEEDYEEENDEDDDDEDEDDEDEEDDDRVPIDLSQNQVYQGVCTLFEDEEGNNILEYISLLHTELIGINKSMENLRTIRKDLTRLADCAEILVKGKKTETKEVQREQTVESVQKKRTK